MNNLVKLFLLITYLAGLVVSEGFWNTALAFVMPPYAIYLLIQKVFVFIGFLP